MDKERKRLYDSNRYQEKRKEILLQRKEYRSRPEVKQHSTEYNRARTREVTLLKYNLTKEQFDNMFVDQSGLCAICRRPPSDEKNLSVDHNHETGEVRGLLCTSCNIGVGSLQDSILVLEAAIRYLKETPYPMKAI